MIKSKIESSFDCASQVVSNAISGSIALSASDLVLLDEPGTFYEIIRQRIRTAKRCIVVSALYLGTGELEKQLLEDLDEALENEKELVVKGVPGMDNLDITQKQA